MVRYPIACRAGSSRRLPSTPHREACECRAPLARQRSPAVSCRHHAFPRRSVLLRPRRHQPSERLQRRPGGRLVLTRHGSRPASCRALADAKASRVRRLIRSRSFSGSTRHSCCEPQSSGGSGSSGTENAVQRTLCSTPLPTKAGVSKLCKLPGQRDRLDAANRKGALSLAAASPCYRAAARTRPR